MSTITLTVRSADGTTIAYDVAGDGAPLILVGGAFQYRAFDQTTDQLQELLADAGFQVVHYDRRGRGDSTDTQPYAPPREIEDLQALIDAVGGSAQVYGMSSGAAIVLRAAVTDARITKAAVYEAPFVVDGSGPPIAADYGERLQRALSSDERDTATALFLTEAAGVPAPMVEGMKQSPMWAGFTAVAYTLAYDNAQMEGLSDGDASALAQFAGITIPVLAASGNAGAPHFASTAHALADTLPNATLKILDGQHHQVDPAVLAPVLADWFDA